MARVTEGRDEDTAAADAADCANDLTEHGVPADTGAKSSLPNGHDTLGSEADQGIVDLKVDAAGETTENSGEQQLAAADDSSEKPVADDDGSKKPVDESSGEEVVVIQDTGFNITIISPGVEPFELPVSSMELVQEIYQVLIDKEETCHRTCFTLQLDGVTLDNFAELKNIEGLKEGSVLKVIEEPYTVREARIHVRHVRDLLKSVGFQDAYSGIDCNSLSLLNIVTGGNILDKKAVKPDVAECQPPDYILPGCKDRPLLPLHPIQKELKAPQCVKVLTYSGWNPPPGNRKMHGDLLYLYVVTLEDKKYHVTATTHGFCVNQCTQDEFNPRPATPKHLYHSLIDLLGQISPAFKRNFQLLLKKRQQKHPFERVATPYQVNSWMAPALDHNVDYIRAEDAFSSRLGYEEHIPGQTRDWNEELQTTRELPRKHLPERLIRERTIFKVHSDFVVAATRGAMSVIDGNIMAINPGEDTKMQMFLWNNIFLSLGFDVKDHFKDFGGDAAAYVAPGCDLQGVKAYAGADIEGLYTLGTVVVDYRGYRVTAQSIIPGILEREQEQSVVYGSIDFGKSIVTNDKYKELLQKTAQSLKIRPHKVVNSKGEEVELYSSVECKGIIGNDGRHYVLDLLRTFPPDVNFLPLDPSELSEAVRTLGYPRMHRHKLACLRQELVDAFVENRYLAFVKNAAFQFQQLRLKKVKEEQDAEQSKAKENIEQGQGDSPQATVTTATTAVVPTTGSGAAPGAAAELETEEAKKLVEKLTETVAREEENTREIVVAAARAVGSLSDTEFDVSFNPDVFQDHVKHADSESENFRREKQLVKDAAEFLLLSQIPNFICECLEHSTSPIDCYTLTEALHHHGINMRYLGTVTTMVEKQGALSYLHSICITALLTRATKHLYKTYMQGVEMMNLSAAISHFLNCYLGSFPTPHTQVTIEEAKPKRKSKRKNKGAIYLVNDNTEWATETPKGLWKKITDEIYSYYGYRVDSDSIDSAVEKYSLQKVSLLRALCKTVGIQILLREYTLDSRSRQAFFEEDIQTVFPVVKHIHPKASDAYHVFTSGQNKIQQGLLHEGYELISEALNLLNNVYGAMHPEIAACARLLARLSYIMGDYSEALVFQQRAVFMSERVLGIDHPNTITEYAHLALYSFANGQIASSLKLMYRALYLALLCSGDNHPDVALYYSNIGLILHAVGEFDLSLRFLQKALELSSRFYGARSLKVALNHHLVARTHSCKGDFRSALQSEKEAYSIYKQLLGEEHDRTNESSECLKHLTQQAVKFQKTMNQLSKGEKVNMMAPLQIQTPTMNNVLETLNLINGIVFVHISPEDIERFREEMVKHQPQLASATAAAAGSQKMAAVEQAKPTDDGSTTVTATGGANTDSCELVQGTPSNNDVQPPLVDRLSPAVVANGNNVDLVSEDGC
jgi:protein TIF31